MINEIKKLDTIYKILMRIDYPFWVNYAKNQAHKKYDSGVLSVVTQLIKKGYLPEDDPIYQIAKIDHLTGEEKKEAEKRLKGSDIITMSNMEKEARKAAEIILKSSKDGDIDDSKLDPMYLRVFDLIQAWGGKTGRMPYVKSPKNPEGSRDNPVSLQNYKKGIKSLMDGDPDSFVKRFTNKEKKDKEGIDKFNMSFATKHLWFWSEVIKDILKIGEREPVYDDRIAKMIHGKNMASSEVKKDDYGNEGRKGANEMYKTIIKDINTLINSNAKEGDQSEEEKKQIDFFKSADKKDIELAIFNFAGHYFQNSGNSFNGFNKETYEKIKNFNGEKSSQEYKNLTKNLKEAVALLKLRKNNIEGAEEWRDSEAEEDFSFTIPGTDNILTGALINSAYTAKVNNKTNDDKLNKVLNYLEGVNIHNLKIPGKIRNLLNYIKSGTSGKVSVKGKKHLDYEKEKNAPIRGNAGGVKDTDKVDIPGKRSITGKQIKSAINSIRRKAFDDNVIRVLGNGLQDVDIDSLETQDNIKKVLANIKDSYSEYINNKGSSEQTNESWNKWSKWATK